MGIKGTKQRLVPKGLHVSPQGQWRGRGQVRSEQGITRDLIGKVYTDTGSWKTATVNLKETTYTKLCKLQAPQLYTSSAACQGTN